MAKVKLNPVLEQVRGQVGDLVFKRYGDRVVMSRKPDTEDSQLSEAQLAHRQHFRQAALYGRMVLADPEARAIYENAAEKKGQPVFSLMVADFLKAPSVDEVDLSGYGGAVGDAIVVLAHDDFAVTAVEVCLTDADGKDLESGPAEETPAGSGRWVYAAQTAVAPGTDVHIQVTASDRPGGKGAKPAEKQL